MGKIVYSIEVSKILVFEDEESAMSTFNDFAEKFNETFELQSGWNVAFVPQPEIEELMEQSVQKFRDELTPITTRPEMENAEQK